MLVTFEKIYLEYSQQIYSFLYKLSGSEDVAEELTQETFCRAFRGFDRFRGDSSVFTWLAAIAKRTYFQYIKKTRQNLEAIDISLVVEGYYQSPAVEDTVIMRDIRDGVEKLLYEIPQKYRDVVLLRVYADMSFADVAETLGITENSAKVIYYRAKKMLKERVESES